MSCAASRGRHGASREPRLRSPFSRALSLFVGLAIALPLSAASASAREDHLANLLESERNTIDVFRRAGGSVVFVTNKALRRDFFSTDISEAQRGTGSGFLWDAEGHVVTNYHVIEGGQKFSIALDGGEVREARLIGIEPRKDLAVLRFDATDLQLSALPLGRSAPLVVGQKVLAIGNPFGLDRTLTTGIISALGREIPAPGGFVIDDVIQTDASINPGNSGGPLLDSSGRLIGVTTAIFSPSGTSAGIGLAIPVDTVARIVPQLILHGEVRRAGLGITALTDHVARSWGFDGVIIRQVLSGSQAERSGLRGIRFDPQGRLVSADIIQAIDGDPVHSFADLANALDGRSPGEIVEVTILRGRKTLRIRVALARLGG